jgi:hypothetical protein
MLPVLIKHIKYLKNVKNYLTNIIFIYFLFYFLVCLTSAPETLFDNIYIYIYI